MANLHNWYEQAFNRRYVELYAHRDNRECIALYNTLAKLGLFPLAGTVLDAACGNGRWLQTLQSNKQPAVGFDLSPTQLAEAKDLPVIRANLLYFPFQNEAVTAVTSIFSSFGYFPTVSGDARQLAETARVLKSGGWFLLDTAPARTLENLVPTGSHVFSDGVKAAIQRYRDGDCAVKTVELTTGEHWEERLRIYNSVDLDDLAKMAGLQLQWRIGDYTGEPFDENQSPRMIGCYVRIH